MRKVFGLLVLSHFINVNAEAQWELLHSDTNTVNVAVHFFDEENGILCGNREFEDEADGFIAKTIDSG